jgi:hypothetical protein
VSIVLDSAGLMAYVGSSVKRGDDPCLLSTTLMDYAVPTAADLPAFEVHHLETPSPHLPGGFKGAGVQALDRAGEQRSLTATKEVR